MGRPPDLPRARILRVERHCNEPQINKRRDQNILYATSYPIRLILIHANDSRSYTRAVGILSGARDRSARSTDIGTDALNKIVAPALHMVGIAKVIPGNSLRWRQSRISKLAFDVVDFSTCVPPRAVNHGRVTGYAACLSFQQGVTSQFIFRYRQSIADFARFLNRRAPSFCSKSFRNPTSAHRTQCTRNQYFAPVNTGYATTIAKKLFGNVEACPYPRADTPWTIARRVSVRKGVPFT